MKWFYNLKNMYRILISVAAWLPLVIFVLVLRPESTDDVATWQAVLVFVFLAVGIFFTVFAVKAAQQDKKVRQQAEAERAAAEKEQRDQWDKEQRQAEAERTAAKQAKQAQDVKEYYRLASHKVSVRLVGNKSQEKQERINGLKKGSEVYIKAENEYKYYVSIYESNILDGDIGYLSGNEVKDLLGRSIRAVISDFEVDGGGKTVVFIDILFFDKEL